MIDKEIKDKFQKLLDVIESQSKTIDELKKGVESKPAETKPAETDETLKKVDELISKFDTIIESNNEVIKKQTTQLEQLAAPESGSDDTFLAEIKEILKQK